MRQTGGDFSLIIALLCREVNHHHPLLYLRGVASQDMAALLDFMYHGETNVAEADLERFTSQCQQEVEILTSCEQNKMRSHRPIRDWEMDQENDVFYSNQLLTVVRSRD